MAERLPRYRPLGISLVAPTRVDYASTGAAQAAGYERLSNALDRISSYAFEKAGQRAKIEGEEFGYKLGQNPEQIKTALEAGASIDDIVGDRDTIFGAASRAAVGAQLRVELETDVRSKLAQLSAAVEGGDVLDPADVETEIDAITEGHASLLSQFGGKYAAQYRATVGTLAAPVYKSALEQSYKLRNAAQAAKFASTLESSKDIFYGIYNNFQGNHTIINGKSILDADVEADILQRSIIDQAINTKNPANINAAKEFLKNMRTNAKINALRKFARENPDQVNLNVGLFGNKTALYFSLDEDGQEKVRNDIREEQAAVHVAEQRKIQNQEKATKTRIHELEAILYTEPPESEIRLTAALEIKALALSGVGVSENTLKLAENPDYEPPIKSDQRGINLVTKYILQERIRDIEVLEQEMEYNNVYGKEANDIRKEFFTVRRARENGVIEQLKRYKKILTDNMPISTDDAIYIAEALPVIERMNEEENKKREANKEFPESLRQTTERYIQLEVGENRIKIIKNIRDQLKRNYEKKLPNFNFDGADAIEVQETIDRLPTLRFRKRDEDEIRDGLQRLRDELGR